jgi:hypothetical protein
MKQTLIRLIRPQLKYQYFKLNFFCMVIIIILTYSCNVVNPIVSIKNTSECGITNISLNFLNPQTIEDEDGEFKSKGFVKKNIYLNKNEEADFIKKPFLYGSISYDCECGDKKKTMMKKFEPFKPKGNSVEVNYIYVDCDENSIPKLEINK